MDQQRVLQRVDTMLAAGRITADEATQLCDAAESGTLEVALEELRRNHARARLATAVDREKVNAEEARVARDRLDAGEDPRFILGVLRKDKGSSNATGGGDG